MTIATVVCSCDKTDVPDMSVNGAVRFTAGIGKEVVITPQSRAADAQWTPGDKIGIFMMNHGTCDVLEYADNRQFTTALGDGVFVPVSGQEIYFPMDNRTVDFIAYYPFVEGNSNVTVDVGGVQTATTQANIDLMWAKSNNDGKGYTKEKNADVPVALTFKHRLSKLTMHCKADPSVGVSSLDGTSVTIKGIYSGASLTPQTGALILNDDRSEISPRKYDAAPDGFHAAYDAIIVPRSYDTGVMTVNFTIGSEIFTWNVDAVTFESGCEHIYEVLITRTGVTATAMIKPWDVETKDPITAE